MTHPIPKTHAQLTRLLAREPDRRGSAHSRGYGATWRRIRLRFLQEHPLCVDCLRHGQTVPATEVDHIKPKRIGGTDEWENLQPLCKTCHSVKTGREDNPYNQRGAR